MTTEHPNATVMREFFAAFGTADRDKLAGLVAPDMTWTFPGTSPISGTFVGVDGLLGGIRTIAMTLGQGINGFELLEVYANDHSAVTIHRDFSTDPDRPFDQRYMLFVTFDGGRMTSVHEVPFDQAASDRFWAERAASFAQAHAS
jgi:ketosteroid isomerase-like protein